ncbi:fimbrial protein [Pseudomonas sp. JR33AA]|uniref:fimbrial protein n=1 Tax=Pseudomonas sp. JR33AA TaxID=2899113 RepID=UPI001F2F2594|nr:fimbrial protein [Pseudomonas sp. JR33AA]MCE5979582.1 fimbrial protein [Pseudomonas sp. JR33AA]
MTFVRPALLTMLFGYASMSHAIDQVVRIEGTVYAAIPCDINNGQPIMGRFDEVQTARIDGSYKTIDLTYQLDCRRATTNELRLQVQAEPAFDATLLKVPGQDNLGIAIKKDGARLPVNSWVDFNSGKTPKLQAVLVKRANSEIKAGPFRAGATLVVDYR